MTRGAFAVLSILAVTGCQSGPPLGAGASQTAGTPLTKAVIIAEKRGSVPSVTIWVPPAWQHQSLAGEDTSIHVLNGPGVEMRFEYWGINTNLACHQAGCGLTHVKVAGRSAELNLASNRLEFRAFVPILAQDGPGPMRGLRASAECSTAEACEVALAVLRSLRLD